MRYLLPILLALLLQSCFLNKKTRTPHIKNPFGSDSLASKDSLIDVVTLKNVGMGSPKPKLSSTVIHSIEYVPDIRIKEVDNGKIITKNGNVINGRVIYSIPQIMKVRSTYQVLLRIAKSKATLSIYNNLTGDVTTSEIPVTSKMNVALIDPSPKDDKVFDIIPDNNAEQIIEEGETYTEWTWNVTPLKAGISKLKIVISIIRADGKKEDVYVGTVEVERDGKAQAIYFIRTYWQWLIGTLILPFGIWLYKRREEKDEDGKPKKKNKKKT